jgi:hypothetical protein
MELECNGCYKYFLKDNLTSFQDKRDLCIYYNWCQPCLDEMEAEEKIREAEIKRKQDVSIVKDRICDRCNNNYNGREYKCSYCFEYFCKECMEFMYWDIYVENDRYECIKCVKLYRRGP